MNVDLAEELMNELTASLEELEKQQTALFQFLKNTGIVTDDTLAPYLSQAGKASGVRWRAVRVRLEYLISAERAREEKAAEKEKRASIREQAGGEKTAGTVEKQEEQAKESKSPKEEGGGSAAPQTEKKATPKAEKSDSPQSEKKAAPQPEKDGTGAAGQGAEAVSSAKDQK
jgi:hypothetical protein